jgi:alkanesulfonate monooxygenase SsuD/methylene tetrahydromethanopterin reductase-like flavin-dependent oxidoreductase (luciferase family)
MAMRGFGLAGEAPKATILVAAAAAERAGYGTFWLSQPAHGSTLATLAAVADQTSGIRLGVGAIPFTRQGPDEIYHEVLELELPRRRLRLGVGSGTGPGAMTRLRHGVERLRQLTDLEIVVAPLGPKACALAGEVADTVLLNWLTPEYAATSLSWIADGAARAGRPRPLVATYVRCALGEAARGRLEADCVRYGGFPHYAAHFRRQGLEPMATTILAQDPAALRHRLAEYEAVLDHVVVRAITPSDSPAEVLVLIEAAEPDARAPATPS